LAEKEAVPLNYSLKKGYCNIFEKKTIQSVIPYDSLKERERFFGQTPLRPRPFSIGRRPLGEHDQIGHADAKKLMWDGCVLTKLAGKFSSGTIKDDMYFKFKKASPYISKAYSAQGARIKGEVNALIAFMIGFPILTLIYRTNVIAEKKSFMKNLLMFVLLGSILAIICVTIYAATYHGIEEKVEVVSLPGRNIGYGWINFVTVGEAFFVDFGNNSEITDAELRDILKKEALRYGSLNPFTNMPITIEDSPGNITVERDGDGKIKDIILYWIDGTPFKLSS
jgi:hypothetical protein